MFKVLGWYVCEDRIFVVEIVMFNVLKSYMMVSGIDFSKIEQILKDFNKIKESGDDVVGLMQKFMFLQKVLDMLKIRDKNGDLIVFVDEGKVGKDGFDKEDVEMYCNNFFKSLSEVDYFGICLFDGDFNGGY